MREQENPPILVDRVVREAERKFITGVGRTQAWVLEKEGSFPKRRLLNPNGGTAVCWLFSELIAWCRSREVVNLEEVK